MNTNVSPSPEGRPASMASRLGERLRNSAMVQAAGRAALVATKVFRPGVRARERAAAQAEQTRQAAVLQAETARITRSAYLQDKYAAAMEGNPPTSDWRKDPYLPPPPKQKMVTTPSGIQRPELPQERQARVDVFTSAFPQASTADTAYFAHTGQLHPESPLLPDYPAPQKGSIFPVPAVPLPVEQLPPHDIRTQHVPQPEAPQAPADLFAGLQRAPSLVSPDGVLRAPSGATPTTPRPVPAPPHLNQAA